MGMQFSKFAVLVKADAAQQLVWGKIAAEEVDSAGEIMDYEASKSYFEAWSNETQKASGGKSLGNVRYMHKSDEAAGKLVELIFDDVNKCIMACAKITTQFWHLVEEGILTGFSIGGRYVSKTIVDGLTRYVADPIEVSIVDRACLKACHFTLTKSDGTTQEVALKEFSPTNQEVYAEAELLAKADGNDLKPADFIAAARVSLLAKASKVDEDPSDDTSKAKEAETAKDEPADVKDDDADKADAKKTKGKDTKAEKAVNSEDLGVSQKWCFGDVQYLTKAEALTAATAAANPLLAALSKAKETQSEPTEAPWQTVIKSLNADGLSDAAADLIALTKSIEGTALAKSMWSTSRLADLLEQIGWLTMDEACFAEWDNNPSTVPSQLQEGLSTLGAALVQMAQESVADLQAMVAMSGVLKDATPIVIKTDAAILQKVGARNSKTDADRIQSIVDLAVELGAKCEVAKVDSGELAKALGERDDLQKKMNEALPEIAKMADDFAAMRAELEALKKQPVDMPAGQLVSKGDMAGDASSVIEKMQAMTPEEQAMTIMKVAQSAPKSMFR